MLEERSTPLKNHSKKKLTFAILSDWIVSPYHISIINSVHTFAKQNGLNLFCFITGRLNAPDDWEKNRNILFEFITKKTIDGLIIMASSIGNYVGVEHFSKYIERYSDIPIVTIGSKINDQPSIITDNIKGMNDLLDHLIKVHKYRKIAYITGPKGNPESEARFKVYLDILNKYNIPFDEKLVVEGDFLIFSGREAVKILLDNRKVNFDVIVAANDTMALGALEELTLRKIRVPDEIAVAGFDNIEASGQASLTTVDQSLSDLGRAAAEVLYRRVTNDSKETDVCLPTELIVRETCGCRKEKGMSKEINLPARLFTNLSESYMEKLNDLGEQLITAFDIGKQLSILKTAIPFFEIQECYIALYSNPQEPMEEARLIFAMHSGKKLPIPGEGIIFSPGMIIPEKYYKALDRSSYIIQGIFHGSEQLGYLILDFGTKEGVVYDTLRQKLSIALKASMMINSIRNQAQNLEEEVKKRTIELMRVNKKLTQEIQERKKAVENLIRSEERFREIATFLPTLVFETDLNMNFLFVNKAGFDIFQIPEESPLYSFSLLDYIHRDDEQRLHEYCSRIIQGISSNFNEFRIVKKDKSKVTLLCKATPILNSMHIQGMRWSAIDIKQIMASITIPEDSFFVKYKLSPREKEVFLLMLQGFKSREIAKKLFITESTVKNHIGAIYAEIGVKNKTEFFNALKDYQIARFGYESFIFSVLSNLVRE